MGNGNNEDYAEVVIEACTGDVSKIKFDEPAWRDSRAQANKVLAELSMIGMGGKDVGEYRTTDLEGWFDAFPNWAHLTRIAVNKMNHQSDVVKPFAERKYDCEHTKEPA